MKYAAVCFLCSMMFVFAHGQRPAPLDYNEMADPTPVDSASWNAMPADRLISFGDVDIRYSKRNVPAIQQLATSWKTVAWKNEKVHTQFVVASRKKIFQLQVEAGGLTDGKGNSINAGNVKTGFVRYVMTDELNKDGGGCGFRPDTRAFDSSLVADGIDFIPVKNVTAYSTQPVWLTLKIPANTPAGNYTGTIKVKQYGGDVLQSLSYTVEVKNYTLPDPKDWTFYLDLWQNPFSIARMHGVQCWSDEHFAIMQPYMKNLANAGQKVITVSMIYDPWNEQTEDPFYSMIKWTKKKNGSWSYDYTVFDKWVSFMMAQGINKAINCYSMIPWGLNFKYYDESLGRDTFIIAKAGSPEYNAHWKPMLTDFARHLKEKGWFSKTAIAMDEREMKDMQQAIALIKSVDKNFRVSLAGNYHPEIQQDIADYCVASAHTFPDDVRKQREKDGMISTYYTCCVEGFPNTFTFSPPAEAAWIGWYAANKNFDGYLRWAYNSWTANPLTDSRFRTWAAGDTYLVYPGPRSSIRFERLIEGIQDNEKIRVLKSIFTKNKDSQKLQQLNAMLAPFEIADIRSKGAAVMLNEGKAVLNTF